MKDSKEQAARNLLKSVPVLFVLYVGNWLWHLALATMIVWPTLEKFDLTDPPNWWLLILLFFIGVTLNIIGRALSNKIVQGEKANESK